MLATQLNESMSQQIASRDSELLSILQRMPSLGSASTESTSFEEDTPQEYQANTVANNAVQLEILKLLKELSVDIKQTKAAVPKRHQLQKTPNDKDSLPRSDSSKYY